MDKQNEVTCKGSITLGTACGSCSRCKTEIKNLVDKLYKLSGITSWQAEEEQVGAVGWICPRCGRGNGPFSATCPCVPMPAPVLTC